jgi:hypothetical protein
MPESDADAKAKKLILEESEERKEDREAAPDTHLEKRTSDEATPPT